MKLKFVYLVCFYDVLCEKILFQEYSSLTQFHTDSSETLEEYYRRMLLSVTLRYAEYGWDRIFKNYRI